MTTEIDTYPNETTWKDAMKRDSQRHIDGWAMESNSKTKLQITWSNDPPPPPTADEIKIKELKDKLKDDTMTFKELLELLRVTGIIG